MFFIKSLDFELRAVTRWDFGLGLSVFYVWVEEWNGFMTEGQTEAELMLCSHLIIFDYSLTLQLSLLLWQKLWGPLIEMEDPQYLWGSSGENISLNSCLIHTGLYTGDIVVEKNPCSHGSFPPKKRGKRQK